MSVILVTCRASNVWAVWATYLFSLQNRFQIIEMRPGGGKRLGLDGAITADEPVAKPGQSSAAAVGAASTGLDNRIGKAAIHILDEPPRLPIGHTYHTTGLRDRSSVLNRFQQKNFSGAEQAVAAQIYPSVEACPYSLQYMDNGAFLTTDGRSSAPVLFNPPPAPVARSLPARRGRRAGR